MPLERDSSDAARSRNISELLKSYKATGMIGNVKPRSEEHARRVAIAAAYANQRESREKK